MSFFVLEGGDGVGKATQAARLVEFLSERRNQSYQQYPVPVLFSFPRYDTPIGQVIKRHLHGDIMLADGVSIKGSGILGQPHRDVPRRAPEDALVFQCLMLADKMEAAREIRRVRDAGGDVVADRWWPSAYAYGGSDGIDDRWLLAVHRLLPQADRNILLKLDPELAVERAVKRAETTGRRIDRYETIEKQKAVLGRYFDLVALDQKAWRIVDASGAEDEVAFAVQRAIAS